MSAKKSTDQPTEPTEPAEHFPETLEAAQAKGHYGWKSSDGPANDTGVTTTEKDTDQ